MPLLKSLLASSLVLAGLGMGGAVFAQSTATVNVTGNITGSCTLDTNNVSINLGSVAASTLTSVGSTSPISAAQNVILTCTASPGITMKMTGTASGSLTNVLALTSASTATGVGVQVLYNNNVLTLNANNAIPTGSTVTLPISARYYRTAAVTAGSANATATLNFTYN